MHGIVSENGLAQTLDERTQCPCSGRTKAHGEQTKATASHVHMVGTDDWRAMEWQEG